MSSTADRLAASRQERYELAVLGSPIAHSQSPRLHRAAYRVLGLDWTYTSAEVTEATLPEYLVSRHDHWRGLSLTMPLKRSVLPLLDDIETVARDIGVVNTVLFDAGSQRGFNTDIGGIARALASVGLTRAATAHVFGAGATAASVLVALASLGVTEVSVFARDRDRIEWLEPIARTYGLALTADSLDRVDASATVPDVVVSTLPGNAAARLLVAEPTRRTSVLLDAAYDPWPSPLASAWAQVGGTVVSGLDMLVHQALLQVRIFVNGNPEASLENEVDVVNAMFAAVGAEARAGS